MNKSNKYLDIEKKKKEELLIMAKNVVSYVIGIDQYASSYEKSWKEKSKDELIKIIKNFQRNYPDVIITNTPIKKLLWEQFG